MPILVFTDGACEPEGSSVGGLIIDGSTVEYFGFIVDESLIKSRKTREDQQQVIGQAELFPLMVARLTWAKRLVGKRVIYFVDNKSARLGLVKGCSNVFPSLNSLCSAYLGIARWTQRCALREFHQVQTRRMDRPG